MSIREAHPISRNRVDARRSNFLRTITTKVCIAKVISHHQNNVRFFRRHDEQTTAKNQSTTMPTLF
jgi:hypothetical protein